ncbi:MAG: aspartate-alanine antiporter-like transporter [Planctomycetota bacterium]
MIGFSLDVNIGPLGLYMLIVAIGYTLGRLAWRGISLGPAAGTLILALLFGRAGYSLTDIYGEESPDLTLGLFGFALFIYSVGFEAGPRFFTSLRHRQGWQFVGIGVLVNVLAVAVALICARVFGFGGSVAAGTLAGALTSAQTYAAAMEAATEKAQLAYSFALTYPPGIVGVILLLQFLPRLLRYDLADSTKGEERDDDPISPLMLRAFEVRHETVVGRSLGELMLTRLTGCTVTRLLRGGKIRVPDASTVLEEGDHVMARGTVDELHRFEKWVGPEIYDAEMRRRMPSGRAIVVLSGKVAGKTLAELDLIRRHHCLIVRLLRGNVDIEPAADVRLERDDIVHVAGMREAVRRVADELGRFERSTHETDIAVYAGGILLGILLGGLDFEFGGLHWTFGFAGGLLISGLLLGRFRRIGRISTHVPFSARQLVRDLGVLLFVTETGLFAGSSTSGGMGTPVLTVLLAGALITVIPMLGALAVAHFVLRMRPVDAWGSVCGGLTSAGAAVALRRATDSNDHAISYAAAYAVASVLLTIAGPLIILLAS